MKHLIFILISAITFQSCTSQNRPLQLTNEELKSVVENGNFTFMAERAIPTGQDINNVMNNMPYRTGMAVNNLSYGYTVKFAENKVSADLPYFGRVYNPSYNRDKGGIKFEPSDYFIMKSEGKKGKTKITVEPQNNSAVSVMYFEILENGKAYLSVNLKDRQPISYDGYIIRNDQVK